MKSFERLVLNHLKNVTGPQLDPLQFAYRANRSVDDAVNIGLHYILEHLDSTGTYARILFVDFSSAFNTIIPELLTPKLLHLGVSPTICQWILSFLTGRTQQVRLGATTSSIRTTSTGAPQGCVLSPLLFSLYTNDCTSTDPAVKHKVRRRHHGHRSHQRRRRVCVPPTSGAAGALVRPTQPRAEHAQDCRDDRGLQETFFSSVAPHTIQLPCVNRRDLQVPGNHSLPGHEVGSQHHLHPEKGPAADVLPEAAEEAWPATGGATTVLHCSHRINPVFFHHGLVWGRHKKGQNPTSTDS
ncbi:uncharacterized protein LOC127607140 isoform X1 [Hippocampus zosterae]|uniref:uncharacterized protein LOC127607140 isoform X1 n=1 Tax=Hippocampus zosterae TaxID=109293 RepID=UPI00223D1F83|nr:uncharacterized protein LOC127607140 isoform X1 [Hippocampus zosterae]